MTVGEPNGCTDVPVRLWSATTAPSILMSDSRWADRGGRSVTHTEAATFFHMNFHTEGKEVP